MVRTLTLSKSFLFFQMEFPVEFKVDDCIEYDPHYDSEDDEKLNDGAEDISLEDERKIQSLRIFDDGVSPEVFKKLSSC